MLVTLLMRGLQQLNNRIDNQREREDRKNSVQLVKYYEVLKKKGVSEFLCIFQIYSNVLSGVGVMLFD